MTSAKIVKMQLNRIKKECDFALLYEDMKGQFPISELKSYEHFLSYLKNPDYYILKWEDFGYILILDVFDYIWVDYLAIFKKYHSMGFGSKILDTLKENFKNKKGIIFEVEKIDEKIPNTIRRQNFYIKNGAIKLCINYFFPNKEGGLNMDLFYIKLSENAPSKLELLEVIKQTFKTLHFDIKNEASEIYSKIN